MAPVQKLGNIDLKKRTSQRFAFSFFTLLSYLVVAILFVILGFIIIKGGSVISWDFLTKAPEDGMTKGGIFPAIVGTFYLILGSSIISFPIGIMSGIYMNEYATNGKLVRFIRIMTNNLSGVPSVVFGLFGMSLFVNTLGWGDSIIAGSFTLALMSLPLIIRTTEEGPEKHRRLVPARQLGIRRDEIADHPPGRAPDGFPEYHHRPDLVGRTRIGRNGSDPVHRSGLFPSSTAGKHLRPVHGIALPLVCHIHERNGYRSLPRHGIRNGYGVDCNRLGCQPAGKPLA